MTADHLRRSPLGERAAELAAASTADLQVCEVPFLAQVSLRVDPSGAAARAVEQALGLTLPAPTSASGVDTAAGARAALWLGPDEWLLVGPADTAANLLDAARPARSAVDVSANRTTVEVRGRLARDLLEKGVALDLHPRSFHAGHVAVTLLARAPVVLWQTEDAPAYRLLVRGSFAGYLADWLLDAAREYSGGQRWAGAAA